MLKNSRGNAAYETAWRAIICKIAFAAFDVANNGDNNAGRNRQGVTEMYMRTGSAVGRSLSPVRWPGMRCLTTSETHRAVPTISGTLKTHLFRNALGHLAH